MAQINELYQMGCFGDNALSEAYADTSRRSRQRRVRDDGRSALACLPPSTADYPDVSADTFGFFPIPTFGNQLQPVHPAGPAKFIYSGSENIDAAKQFLAYLMEPESLQYLLDNEPQFVSLPFEGVDAEVG